MGLLSDLKNRYNDIRYNKLISGTKEAGKLLDSGLDRLGIKGGEEITQNMLLEVQKGLFTAYLTKRDKEYQKFLTSVGYNSSDYDTVRGEFKKFADWRKVLRQTSAERFGGVWDANFAIKKLCTENQKLLKGPNGGNRAEELKSNAETLEAMKAVSEPLSKMLEDIWKAVEEDLTKSEDEYARQIMQSL
jgi:hypothetical protein